MRAGGRFSCVWRQGQSLSLAWNLSTCILFKNSLGKIVKNLKFSMSMNDRFRNKNFLNSVPGSVNSCDRGHFLKKSKTCQWINSISKIRSWPREIKVKAIKYFSYTFRVFNPEIYLFTVINLHGDQYSSIWETR